MLVTPVQDTQPLVEASPEIGASSSVPSASAGINTSSPTPTESPSVTAASPPTATVNSSAGAGQESRTPFPLPPLGLVVPAIDVDVPVVLADNQNLPRVPLAGWYFKSAFPATAGNMVLIGHVNGQAAIFERLHEVGPGDEIRVSTGSAVHIYTVDSVLVVDQHAVEVLAPTTDAVVTLITCAGEWNPVTRSFAERLVVRGRYTAVEEVSSSLIPSSFESTPWRRESAT
jgi:LPXTG-site transpeptidase (sortase) family protein